MPISKNYQFNLRQGAITWVLQSFSLFIIACWKQYDPVNRNYEVMKKFLQSHTQKPQRSKPPNTTDVSVTLLPFTYNDYTGIRFLICMKRIHLNIRTQDMYT